MTRVTLSILLIFYSFLSPTKAQSKSFIRQVSLQIKLSEDLNLTLDGSGPLGSSIELTATPETAQCTWKAMVRDVLSNKVKSAEIFIEQICTPAGDNAVAQKIQWPKWTVPLTEFSTEKKIVDLSPEQKKITAQILDLQIIAPKKK